MMVLMAKGNAMWMLQPTCGYASQVAPVFGWTLMPSVLDKAFRGES